MSRYGVCSSLVPNRPRLSMRQGAAPGGATGSGGGAAGGSALPKLESEVKPAPSALLVPMNSALDLMNSRRRAYSSGAVISLLGGGRGGVRISRSSSSDFRFGGAGQGLASGFRNVRFVSPAGELLARGGGHERAAGFFWDDAFTAFELGVLARGRRLEECFTELLGQLFTGSAIDERAAVAVVPASGCL